MNNRTNKKKPAKSNSLLSLLKKWFTWQKASVLLTGLGIVVTIAIFYLSQGEKEREIDVVKNRIFANISTINNTFHPESIPANLDSLHDVKLVREFQEKALSICTLWESIERTEPYLYHLKNSPGEADYVWEKNIERERKCDSLYIRVEKIVCEIQAFASDHNLDAYQLVNYSLLFKFRNMMAQKSNMYVQASRKATAHREKLEIEECYKLYDALRENPDYYAFDDTFFEFLIETNKVYEVAIKKHLNSTNE